MEKSIQSSFIGCYESDTFGADNSEKSVEHGETEGQERIEKLNAVLESPDSVEDLYVRSNSRMDGLHVALNFQFHLTLNLIPILFGQSYLIRANVLTATPRLRQQKRPFPLRLLMLMNAAFIEVGLPENGKVQ